MSVSKKAECLKVKNAIIDPVNFTDDCCGNCRAMECTHHFDHHSWENSPSNAIEDEPSKYCYLVTSGEAEKYKHDLCRHDCDHEGCPHHPHFNDISDMVDFDENFTEEDFAESNWRDN